MSGLAPDNVVAPCDSDVARARGVFEQHLQAKRCRDFRGMLEKENSLNAVVVSTPDHTHAVAAIAGVRRGLHV